MKCKICEVRKPRRYCPGVLGDICSICCGNEREQTIDCPLDCPYLRESRQYERPPGIDPATVPNQDVPVTEEFVRDHTDLIHITAAIVFRAAIDTPGAIDYDLREALDSLIRTHRTLTTGLYYDSRPSNPVAAAIFEKARVGENEVRKILTEKGATFRDSEFIGALVYLQRQEFMINNGRRRGRSFIHVLRAMFPKYVAAQPASSSLIIA